MKNLHLVSVKASIVDTKVKPELACISSDTTYIFASHKILAIKSRVIHHVCDLQQIPQLQDNHVLLPVHMDVCYVTGHLVVCLASGELIAINPTTCNAEYIGCVDPGITTAAWSPGCDLFAVVTKALNLVILSQDLEALTETELGGLGEEQFMSVGWGKKETQFRGSEGKLKPGETVETCIKGYDDGRVRISWRGDGECLVVSYIEESVRHLKVFSNVGILLHSSEPIQGLESALYWRPNGSVIASTQQLPNKHVVCFFEKNLLPHGGFPIPEECIVNELLWNCDSSILAVVIKLLTSSETSTNVIKLYTVGNYHWYHKFSLCVPENENILNIEWDQGEACTLRLVTSIGDTVKHSSWNYRWAIDSSTGASPDDQAFVAVVDGCRLLLTAFKKTVIPPPMSSSTHEFDCSINTVGFIQFGAEDNRVTSNDLFVQCMDGSFTILKYNCTENKHDVFTSGKVIDNVLFQVSWVAVDRLLGCAISDTGDYALVALNINNAYDVTQCNVSTKPLTGHLLAIRRVPKDKTVLLWDHEQATKAITLDSMEICDMARTRGTGRLLAVEIRQNVFTFDSAHRLSADDVTIASNVTSFRVIDSHLLVTTLQHKLLCWSLTNLTAPASERPVERGARIITAVPGTSSVVLQLPRGNLEVVQPRALTITALKTLLDSLRFSAALMVMRRERVNLNLLYDHNPLVWESNVKLFVKDVSHPSLLCTFIAELSNESVTQTLYSSFYSPVDKGNCGKIDLICSLLLSVFESLEEKEKFLLPIISCLVKKGQTEEALMMVQSTLLAEKSGSHGPVSSTEGLTHVLYLVDVEQLFKVALGTYDLNLVMFIASKAQKDPKEYLPFLSGLQKMEENYQKFTIDNFLKRYKKALNHLALCPDRVQECLDFVVKHSLYRAALLMFTRDTDSWKAVCVMYGAELTRLARHEEAGLLLQRAGEFVLAQHAFARAGAWRQELACADALRLSEEQKTELYKSIADSLLTSRRYIEAASLLLDYAKDIEGGVTALCAANMYDEAVRVTALHDRKELVGSTVRPSALAAREAYEKTISDIGEAFEVHLQRLRDVQHARELNGPIDWDDTASESSRGSSRGSSRASSTRSAKNSRKLERNLMKKGGPYEEVALIAALHDGVTQAVALKLPVKTLNLTLIGLGEQSCAASLQSLLQQLLVRIKTGVSEVWPGPSLVSIEGSTSNSIAAAFTAVKRQLPAPVQALQPKALFAPDLCNGLDWQLDILLAH